MIIDIQTIVLSGGALLSAIISPLCNGLFRRPCTKTNGNSGASSATIKFSVIITAHDQGYELEQNLPAFLSQDYVPGYEVIVVDESSTDRTDDLLTHLKAEYPHLYTTFIPNSSHYLSRKKLALTIGVKAAKNEWIILTDADCRPESDKWLQTIASKCCDTGTDLVLGYTNYSQEAAPFQRFERLLTSCYVLRKAQKGTAYRYNGNNLAMRKSLFMAHNGFIENLMYLRGEYDFIVNEYATKGRTAIATEPEATIRQDQQSRKVWNNMHLYYMETRKHLKRSIPYRMLFNVDTLLLHANYIFLLALLAYSIMTSDIVLCAIAAIAIIITVVMRIIIAHKTVHAFGEHINPLLVPFMEIRILWHNAWLMLRHHIANKYDFIRR